MLIEEREIILSDGRKVQIRSGVAKDAEQFCEERFVTCGETPFLSMNPEEGKPDQRRMKEMLVQVEHDPRDFMVTAFAEGRVVGDASVSAVLPYMKFRHRASMGIVIRKEYWGCGLGSRMLEILLEQAEENGFEQIELGVYAENGKAIHLYEKYGFQRYGIQPRAFKLKDGSYCDEIIMVKFF